MRKTESIVCRPCKEANNWEIAKPDGSVYSKHYKTKEECMKAGRAYAEEYGCDMRVEDLKNSAQATKQTHSKRSQ